MWQTQIKNMITSIAELAELVELKSLAACEHPFPVRVPHHFAMRIQKGNPNDPLLLQVLTQPQESLLTDGYIKDPLQEKPQTKLPGLIQKFPGRVLITVTGSCAIHCRYCFRKHFPYQDNRATGKNWPVLFEHIAKDKSLYEVILSGGDPLMLQDKQLAQILYDLSQLEHIQLIRIHTRLPVVIPHRIDDAFIKMITPYKEKLVFVYHVNHPQELCEEIKTATIQLKELHIPIYNQSVLLKNINDNVVTLTQLSFALFAHGIQPYYLHLLDKVMGTQHFDMSLSRAKQLYKHLRSTLPGYLVPQLVQEIPGQTSKILVQPV